MTRLRHYDIDGMVRFVTFSCFNRLPLLGIPGVADILREEINTVCGNNSCRVLAWVIMPEHVHLVLLPSDGTKVGLLIREIKSRSARRAFQECDVVSRFPVLVGAASERHFWLRRCFDHNCRTAESVEQKIRYCHFNPVRRGLVLKPEDWRWSSYEREDAARGVPL